MKKTKEKIKSELKVNKLSFSYLVLKIKAIFKRGNKNG